MATGAVVAGRRTFEPAGGWGGDHHDGVPIFVLSRREPDSEIGRWPLVTYVTDVTIGMTAAKRAAGDKNVLVHGAGTAELALAAGVLDELEIHLIPVLLGQGRRLFDNLGPEHIELERTRISRGRPVSPTCTTGSSAEVSVPPPSPYELTMKRQADKQDALGESSSTQTGDSPGARVERLEAEVRELREALHGS